MKKILLTENQLKKMIKNKINENLNADRYERIVSVSVSNFGFDFRGEKIDWVSCRDIKLSFVIEQEHRSWGIKDIFLSNIQGPSEIELTLTPQTDNPEDVEITVPVNWDNVEIDTQKGEGVVTVGDDIEIRINTNENGDIIVEKIYVVAYSL